MGEWISWTPDLAVNVPKIDEQHKELLKQFNDLGDAVWDGKGRETIGDILHFLADYTVRHFSDEEALMDAGDYADRDVHKREHAALVFEVLEFMKKFDGGEIESSLVITIVNRLGDWTRNHIRVRDKVFGLYLQSKNLTEG